VNSLLWLNGDEGKVAMSFPPMDSTIVLVTMRIEPRASAIIESLEEFVE
jgi:hypothetical protein